jgi:hypothetical protein
MRIRPIYVASVSVAALILSACSAATIPTSRDASTDVAFTACTDATCTGEINGADFEIVMPDTWNGTLLLYSHGYRPAEPFPPNFNPIVRTAPPAPGWDDGDTEVGDALLERGYAIAGSAYASNGWAVEDGVIAAKEVYDHFVENIATPRRVLVWGDSLGGLITTLLAEQESDWVDGAAPLCGVMAGLEPNIDLAFDVAYGVQQLLFPEMVIANYDSYEQALQAWEGGASRLIQSARDGDTEAISKILTIAAIVDAPARTRTFDGSDVVSQVSGTIESLLTALGYGTVGRFEIEQRFGGNVSGNVDTSYSDRVDEEERTLIDTVGGEGVAARYLRKLDLAPRTEADPAARAEAIQRGGSPTGATQVPMITMHTAADPLVIVQNQSVYAYRYNDSVARGAVRGGLVQTYTTPPFTYPSDPGAPYGAGHCNFTLESRLAVIDLLQRWVQDGVYPGLGAIEQAMGPDSGYAPGFEPGVWPRRELPSLGN